MKNRFYILLTISLLFVFASCSDFLDEDNKVGSTADLTYQSKSGIDGLVGSCYSFARGWYGKEAGLGLSEMGTDLFCYGGDNKQNSLCKYSFTSKSLDGNTSDNPCFDQYWELYYCAVDVCNNALKYVPDCPAISDELKTRYEGEVLFMRALYYFNMVNMWGPIPYRDEPVSSVTTAPVRMEEEYIYSKILEDLDNSIGKFNSIGYKTKTDSRANYWAARALKARVLLYAASWLGGDVYPNVNGNTAKATPIVTNTTYAVSVPQLYALAKDEAQAVIDGSYASLYDNYEDVWSMNNEEFADNNEALFSINYSPNITTPDNCIPHRYKTDASGKALDYNGLITRTGYSRGGSAMLLMFVSKWNNGCSDLGGNGNKTSNVFVRVTKESNRYIESSTTGEDIDCAEYSVYSRGYRRYLPSLYLWETLAKYGKTDQRTDATLLEAYKIADERLAGNVSGNYPLLKDTAIYYCPLDGDSPEGQAMQAWAKNRYRIQFMYNGDIPIYSTGDLSEAVPTSSAKAVSDVYGDDRYNSDQIGGASSYPGIKKFLNNVVDVNFLTHDISDRDAMVIRISEMYLIKAECQLKGDNDAPGALATINELRIKRAISGQAEANKRSAIDMDGILEERAIELCGEQQRWFDLKRTGKLEEYVNARDAQATAFDASIHYYRPIPDAEIESCTNFTTESHSTTGLWQNYGY